MACIDDVKQLIGELQDGELCMIEFWCATGVPPDWIYYELKLAREIAKFMAMAKKQNLLPITSDEMKQVRQDLQDGMLAKNLVKLITDARQVPQQKPPKNKV